MVRREARRVSTITAETSLRQAQMRNKSGMSEEQAPGQLFITLGRLVVPDDFKEPLEEMRESMVQGSCLTHVPHRCERSQIRDPGDRRRSPETLARTPGPGRDG